MVRIQFVSQLLQRSEYDCSDHTHKEWALLFGTPQIALGSWSIIFGVVCLFLYIPSLIVFTVQRRFSCFKMMQFHVVVDMIGLLANSVIFGLLMLQGDVFCSDPIVNIVTYVIANSEKTRVKCIANIYTAAWCASSIICTLLVMNRICELTERPNVFKGNRVYVCFIASISYGLFMSLFTPPFLINSTFQNLFVTPFIPGHDMKEYSNELHATHNISTMIVIPFLYLLLFIILCKMTKAKSALISYKSQSITARIFIQASVVISFTTIGTMIFNLMELQILPTPQIVITMGMILYQLVHGAPCFIYLFLNQTVRTYAFGNRHFKHGETKMETTGVSSAVENISIK